MTCGPSPVIASILMNATDGVITAVIALNGEMIICR
jgi:hypothetical protein